MTRLIANEDLYHRFIQTEIPKTKKFLWIGTADIKDLHVQKGRRFVPFLQILAELVRNGVEVRLIHAKEPGPRFREDFDRFPELIESERFERILCPRVHFKCLIVDGKITYVGSANLTGAGMGAKNPERRNFEAGILSADPVRRLDARNKQAPPGPNRNRERHDGSFRPRLHGRFLHRLRTTGRLPRSDRVRPHGQRTTSSMRKSASATRFSTKRRNGSGFSPASDSARAL